MRGLLAHCEERFHVGFLIGLYIAMIVYPVLDEWQQRRRDKKLLRKLRLHHAKGHRFDATKGEWIDE
jgi:hypothetical protein